MLDGFQRRGDSMLMLYCVYYFDECYFTYTSLTDLIVRLGDRQLDIL